MPSGLPLGVGVVTLHVQRFLQSKGVVDMRPSLVFIDYLKSRTGSFLRVHHYPALFAFIFALMLFRSLCFIVYLPSWKGSV